MTKINGQKQIEALGNAAPDSMRWGDFIRMGRACDRFLRERGLIHRGPYRSPFRPLKSSVAKGGTGVSRELPEAYSARLGDKLVLCLDDLSIEPDTGGTGGQDSRPLARLRFVEREGRRHWVVVNVQYTPSV